MWLLIKIASRFEYYKKMNINEKINDKFCDFRAKANSEFILDGSKLNYLKLPRRERIK